MKLVSNSYDCLVIEDRPVFWTLTVWLMGAGAMIAVLSGQTDGFWQAAMVFGLGAGIMVFAWYCFPFQRLTFDRRRGHLIRRIARVTGGRDDVMELRQIQRAALQSHWGEETRMERLALLTDGGPVPLEFGYFSQTRAPLVAIINAWLDAPEPRQG
ncbi:MAG: hypothetical protein AAGF74_17110 [Pseudomonadota bacterium]